MLKWIRGKRLDLKTTIIVLVLATAMWAVVTYANIKEFIPREYRERADSAARR